MRKYFILFAFIFVIFGYNTASACGFNSLSSIKPGTNSAAILNLQNCLKSAGYENTDKNGVYGKDTTNAVKSFYKDFLGMDWDGKSFGPRAITKITPKNFNTKIKYRYAKNESDMQKYVDIRNGNSGGGIMYKTGAVAPMAMDASTSSAVSGSSNAERVSNTNVQTIGIDEPDVVKTDGKNLFMGKPQYWYGYYNLMNDVMPTVREGGVATDAAAIDSKMAIMPPYPMQIPKTQIIGVNPVDNMSVLSEKIDASGEMLLVKDKKILVVFSGQNIVGYDVNDTVNPVKKWTVTMKDNTYLITARQKGNDIYLVTQTSLYSGRPCPYIPIMTSGGKDLSIACNRILIPETISPITNTYTVIKLDSVNGSATAKTSIAEDGYNSTVSMFNNNLYIATNVDNSTKIYNDLMLNAYTKYLSSSAISRIKKIQNYEISDYNKYEEIQTTIQNEMNTKDDNERLKIEKDTQNEIEKMQALYIRETYKTKIARIDLNKFEVSNVGILPGRLVNQFAMDEYNGHLRVATTVGEMWGSKSANDVYVLGMDMKEKGIIKDLGLTERIYSVRFMGDTGYLVTFRQTDPFYVLDLKNPAKPTVAGELKIPGYSSYLEDLGNGYVLGLGRDNGDFKLSLFNVKDVKNPTEVSKYLLKNNWSEAENNHHAFLRDADHKVFFIPGTDGGYVFSYDNNEITLKKSVAGNNVKRAIYIGDYMYVISDSKITVLDEKTWEVKKEFEIK